MGKYTLPEMPYAYDALEPHIDARTMEIHHTKHHQKYTDGMNGALEKLSPELQSKDIVDILSSINDVPDDVRGAINFNGGGYDNHKLFWNNMKLIAPLISSGTSLMFANISTISLLCSSGLSFSKAPFIPSVYF